MISENRVYLNSEHFKESFNEEDKEKLTKISVLKYQLKKTFEKSTNLKKEYSFLIKDKKNISNNFQNEYLKITMDFSYSEGKEKWLNSESRTKLCTEYYSVKRKLKDIQIELKNIKKEIKIKNALISKLRK